MVNHQILLHFLHQIVILNFKYILKMEIFRNKKKWYFMPLLLL